MFYRTVLSLCLVSVVGCTAIPERASQGNGTEKQWAPKDAPSLLDPSMKYDFDSLPLKGEAARIPWAGNYWPTYRDNINFPWAGEGTVAPSTKFAKAFGREGLEDRISKEFGIDSRTSAKTCTSDDVCDDKLGETCSMRTGEEEGRCVPTWFGICHAWAPAAILEAEPQHPVTHNGVDFAVQDIKALVSLSYDEGVDVRFMSLRCRESFDDEGNVENGVPVDDACQDTNAGSFHVAITNILGIQGESLVEDRTIDFEVWNQPVRGYEVTLNEEVDLARAISLTHTEGDAYTLNAKAVSFRRIKTRLEYITESDQDTDGYLADSIDEYTLDDRYEYLLELDTDGKIVGGEWLGSSRTAHPDFLWRPVKKTGTELAKSSGKSGTGIKWSDVQMLLKKSIQVGGDDAQGFDWGDACDAGSGDFDQDIAEKATVTIGKIPADKASVRIELLAEADVDVQLIDEETGHEIIAWPNGDLNGADEGCAAWHGTQYCYSGYNGVGSELGNEWIEVRGTTNRPLIMKAYGYQAGDAIVEYEWQAPQDCVDAGEGTFTQLIQKDAVVEVGIIPAGKANIRIELTSDEDVDVQLYSGTEALVQWPDGRLSDEGVQTLNFNGMLITWSGYNGDGTNLGHEYITIAGTVPSDLTMKAFGYAQGDAQVDYAWGLDASEL